MTAILHINGHRQTTDADPETPLPWVLRDHLGLTGTKLGCGIAQCGVCTAHIDGVATRCCVVPLRAVASQLQGALTFGLSMALNEELTSRTGASARPASGWLGPAIANAIFRVTGRRIRATPITRQPLTWI